MAKKIVLIFISLLITSCINLNQQRYHAIVGKDLSGDNNYSSLEAALAAASSSPIQPFRIFIQNGDYYEKITISRSHIQLIGEDKYKTRLFYDAYAGQTYAEGKTWGTPGSATLTIRANAIYLENITIENSFDFLSNDTKPNEDPSRITNAQAVALFVDKGSDNILVRNSRLLGFQDTLFVNSGRSWFDKSLIAGNVDFIFGNGNALFTDSEIKTRARGKVNYPHGYLVAPSTQLSDFYGLTFINCRLTRDNAVPDNSVPLGRPWHPTTQFDDGRYADPNAIGKAVFINSWMDKHITIDGWYSMSGTAKDGTKIPFYPEDSRFFEYKSKGPGAQINFKRRQLTDEEEKDYSKDKIFDDDFKAWLFFFGFSH